MRFANKNEDLVGKVAVCSVGRVAIITGKERFNFHESWVGIGFDGKGTWASKNPCIVAESGEEFREKLENLFDGKMSINY